MPILVTPGWNQTNKDVHTRTQAFFFGLWTYSEPIEMEYNSLGDILSEEYELVAECRFNMKDSAIPGEGAGSASGGGGDISGPDNIFLVNGPAFTMARACAISAVVLGFISMIFLWLTAANSKWSCSSAIAGGSSTGRRAAGRSKWILFASLLTCAILLNFVFLVMASSVCRDGDIDESRHCELEEGSGLLFAGSFSWTLTAIGSLKIHNSVDHNTHQGQQQAQHQPVKEEIDEVGTLEEDGNQALETDDILTTSSLRDNNQIV